MTGRIDGNRTGATWAEFKIGITDGIGCGGCPAVGCADRCSFAIGYDDIGPIDGFAGLIDDLYLKAGKKSLTLTA